MRLEIGGEGPLVIKLAGIAGGVRLYREEIEAARREGFRVAALDLTGDRADDPLPGPPSWAGYAGEVAAAIREAGGGPAVLWGTSFGCLVALATAARHAELVRGLLLCHPPEPLAQPRPYARLERWIERRDDPERAALVAFRLGFGLLAGWEFLYPSALVRLGFLWREARAAATPGWILREKLRLLWHEPPGRMQAGVPVLVLAGAWDTIAPARGARRLAATLPGAQLRVLGASGHLGAYSRPGTYARWCVTALRSMAEPPATRASDPFSA